MLSQTVEYALRAVVHLADRAPEARTTEQIAEVTQVPKAYLSKVLQSLVRSGVVRSQRGLGGGMTLSRSASEISLLEVVNGVDPLQRIKSCPLGLTTHGANLCPLHRRLDESLEHLERSFSETSLEQILSQPGSPRPLCESSKS